MKNSGSARLRTGATDGQAKIVVILLVLAVVLGVGVYLVWDGDKIAFHFLPSSQDVSIVPSLTFLGPSISSAGDQILKPGTYEVEWESVGVEKLAIAIVSEDGESVVDSGIVEASRGTYTVQIPEIPGVKGAQPTYRFLIYTSDGVTAESNPFVIGCLACDPPGY